MVERKEKNWLTLVIYMTDGGRVLQNRPAACLVHAKPPGQAKDAKEKALAYGI
jgi:hypothetical protein